MAKIIRLTESDLTRLVKRVLFENEKEQIKDIAQEIANRLNPIQIGAIKRELKIGGKMGLAKKLEMAVNCSNSETLQEEEEDEYDITKISDDELDSDYKRSKKETNFCYSLGAIGTVGTIIASVMDQMGDITLYNGNNDFFVVLALMLGPALGALGTYSDEITTRLKREKQRRENM
jgi:hypothetical protein